MRHVRCVQGYGQKRCRSLDSEGTAIRTHGGVALPELRKELTSYQERRISHPDNKRRIGEAAAKLIHDRETIILDVSTTVNA